MQISIWQIVFIVGVAQGVFLSIALVAMKTGNRRAARVLAALVAVFTLMILTELVDRAMHSPSELLLVGVGINLELAIGPLLLLFVRSVFEPDRSSRKRDMRHFLPLLLGVVVWLSLTSAMYLQVVEVSETGFRRLIAAFVAFKAGFLFCYIVASHRTLRRGLQDAGRFMVGRNPVDMRWLGYWLVGLSIVAGTIYLTFFLGYWGLPVPDSDDVGSLILAMMIYLLSLLVLLRPWILSVRPRQMELRRYANEIRRIEEYLDRERPFVDPDFSLRDMADALGLGQNRLSSVLNDGMRTSFYDLLARYRLDEFERLARQPQHRARPVLELAYESGFNSKASFYRAFRRLRGTTPTAFLEHALS